VLLGVCSIKKNHRHFNKKKTCITSKSPTVEQARVANQLENSDPDHKLIMKEQFQGQAVEGSLKRKAMQQAQRTIKQGKLIRDLNFTSSWWLLLLLLKDAFESK